MVSDQPGIKVLLGEKLIVKMLRLGHRCSFDHAAEMLKGCRSNEYWQVTLPRNVPHERFASKFERTYIRPLRIHALNA